MPRQITSSFRRHRLANSILLQGSFIMRPYSCYLRANVLCVTFSESESYKQYVKFGRSCELAWPAATVERLHQANDKLLKKIANARRQTQKADARLLRLRQQRRLLQKKLRDISNKEMRNIANLEVDELLLEALIKPAEILNPFSPRFFSFLNLTLLNSPNRTLAKPLGNR
jgi:hypothetical protein